MQTAPSLVTPESSPARWRSRLSLAALLLAIALLLSNAVLISPPPAPSYPGAIEWHPDSLLRPLIDALSLFGALQTVRGVEIKDVALHVAVALLMILLAIRAVVSGLLPPDRRTARGAWFSAEVLFVGWVVCSALSALWSGDAQLALTQSTLFGLNVAWAIGLSWILEGRDVPRLIWGYIAAATICAGLCIWYYHERNPFHRPGFPIGNPSSLAGVTVPAFLICAVLVAGGLAGWLRGGERVSRAWIGAAAIALVPLGYTLHLTSSRAAIVGGVLGIAGVLFLTVTRRARLAILVTLGVLALAGVWRLSASMEEVAMARGATVRFRLYTWQYAAEMWSRRPISGNGAGCFPRAASGLSTTHQKLDPAAFLGEKIAHVHNEFFEVLAEIGLIGGLTFVGGVVATLVAASGMLQSSFSRQRFLVILGLVAGFLALLGDSLFGVGLRLPGMPPVFYTLLGALWAQCRAVSKQHGPPAENSNWLRDMVGRRFGLAALALLAAGMAAWFGSSNLRGLRGEVAAITAAHDARYEDAIRLNRAAAERLLDPIRILLARERVIYALAYAAEQEAELAFDVLYDKDADPDVRRELVSTAIRLNERAYRAAEAFHQKTPGFGRAAAIGGRSADILAQLATPHDSQWAAIWRERAWQAWRLQRLFNPYERGTLLALLSFPMPIGDQLGLLRDALRAGAADADWLNALQQISNHPQFAETLAGLTATVTPYTTESRRDALMISAAPEMFRLRGIWRHNQGDSAGAAGDAAHAADLYQPLRSRVPTLESVALSEQAEYEFSADNADAARAIETARRALERLPQIQAQQYDKLAAPFRQRLARYLLTAGRRDEAAEILDLLYPDATEARGAFIVQALETTLNTFGWRDPAERPPLTAWIEALLELAPQNSSAWYWRSLLVAEQGPEAARAYLDSLPTLTPPAREAVSAALCDVLPEACQPGPPAPAE